MVMGYQEHVSIYWRFELVTGRAGRNADIWATSMKIYETHRNCIQLVEIID